MPCGITQCYLAPGALTGFFFQGRAIGGGRGQWLGGIMASVEHEPITGVWGRAPNKVQGQSPWSGGQGGEAALKLKAFWSLDVQRSQH